VGLSSSDIGASEARSEGLGRIDDNRDAEFAADRVDFTIVTALPVKVGGDDRPGEFPDAGASIEFVSQKDRVHVPGSVVAIDKNGSGTLEEDRGDAPDECEGRGEDFIPRSHAEVVQSQVHSRCTTRDRQAVSDPGVLVELLLEGVNHGTERRDIVAFEGLLNQAALQAAHVGRREEDACSIHRQINNARKR